MQFLDAGTARHLGFEEIWSRIKPVSSLGRALHRKAQPFSPEQKKEMEAEWERLEKIAARFKEDAHIGAELDHLLAGARDVAVTIRRSLQGQILDDTEFYEIKKLLHILMEVKNEIDRLGWNSLLPVPIDVCSECRQALSVGQGSRKSFYVADGYDRELARVRAKRSALENSLLNKRTLVEDQVKAVSGRILSTEGEISVSTAEAEKIAALTAIEGLQKVQETADFVRFRLTPDVTGQIERELSSVRQKEERCKERVRRRLTGAVAEQGASLLQMLELLAFLDFLLAKAKFCAAYGGIKPEQGEKRAIAIFQGRHLVLEEEVTGQGLSYTPLDLEFQTGVTIITGPNMGGKTAGLKTVGLLIAMAQFGLLVPAQAMKFKPRRFIAAHFSSAGNPAGLSSFAGEIAFISDALEASSSDGLILIDEIAHGTNPAEGAAIARAVLESLNERPSITVITTHYPELAALKQICHLRVRGLDHEQLKRDWAAAARLQLDVFRRAMDYRLQPADEQGTVTSDAAVVAEALGLDERIIRRAKGLLQNRSPE